MANPGENESPRLFLVGILFLLLSPPGVLAVAHFLEPYEGSGIVVLLLALLYPSGVVLLVRSRPAASRQSLKGRVRFISGIVLVILAPLGLLAIGFYVAIAALGAGMGDAPASSFWSSPLIGRAWLATLVPAAILGCGIYQLIRSRSCSPGLQSSQPQSSGRNTTPGSSTSSPDHRD